MGPEQTAPLGAVCSGFMVFASMIKSNLNGVSIYAVDLTRRQHFHDENIVRMRLKVIVLLPEKHLQTYMQV